MKEQQNYHNLLKKQQQQSKQNQLLEKEEVNWIKYKEHTHKTYSFQLQEQH